MPVKEPLWKKHLGTLKDLIFILGIVISAGGWFTAEAVAKNETKNKIEALTNVIEDYNTQLVKINDILNAQQELNGKIIQYMEMDKFSNHDHGNDRTTK